MGAQREPIEAQYRVLTRWNMFSRNCFFQAWRIFWQPQLRLPAITSLMVTVTFLLLATAEMRKFLIGLIIVSLISGILMRIAQSELKRTLKRRRIHRERKEKRATSAPQARRPTRPRPSLPRIGVSFSFGDEHMTKWVILAAGIGLGLMLIFSAPVLPELGYLVLAFGVLGFFGCWHEENSAHKHASSHQSWESYMDACRGSKKSSDDEKRR